MKTIAITGATGQIGRALQAGLADRYALRPLSLDTGVDLRHDPDPAQHFAGCDMVIHLAWQYYWGDDPDGIGRDSLNNVLMHRRVLDAAIHAGVPRLIMASSVHADYFYDWTGPDLLTTDRRPRANGLYGGLKLLIEALDREAATDHHRITDLRFGGVTPSGQPHPKEDWERRVWLSHPDLCRLITAILEHADPPHYACLYAVSDNEGRVHDTANPFGWSPQDRATRLTSDVARGAST